MSFARPATASLRLATAPRAIMRPRALPKRIAPLTSTSRASAFRRTYATSPSAPEPSTTHNTLLMAVLAAVLGVGVGGYFYLKPVRDVAAIAHEGVKSAKENASQLSTGLSTYAQAVLPPGAFALYKALDSQEGGIAGFLSKLKGKDLDGALDELKQVGGDDAKKIIDKIQQKVKDAKGKIENVDWKSLATELKDDLPASAQGLIAVIAGKIPDSVKDLDFDFDSLIKKAKEVGGDQLKQVEESAGKVYKEVEKARKEGKDTADAFLKGLKEAAPADVDSLIKQLKEAASKAGLPADTAEAWLKSKAKDGKVDAEALAKQVESRLKDAAQYIPGEPKDLIKQVEQVSPSLAKLLQQALQQADVIDEKGNKKQ
ncbi:hypothetical protein I302_106771 [Kwoniella bestiolae CBS 10118]|uniref:Uncharacterized protein n=1 Tax=Kwoniella bestiolae CBS 10118 TaxID=1296100 RepID=A0A1B9G0F3_9TREE|nr:hypothetical protein I302_05963 [Kwoniella bestiolae CBS 10118]OCF24503.1 hypothetical protein I302_05963 [Kwoniella bestiolae CBS 10118]